MRFVLRDMVALKNGGEIKDSSNDFKFGWKDLKGKQVPSSKDIQKSILKLIIYERAVWSESSHFSWDLKQHPSDNEKVSKNFMISPLICFDP